MTRLGLSIPIASSENDVDLTTMAQLAEDAGASSLWAPDHIVQFESIESHHPFSAGGRAAWSPRAPWPEVMTTIAWLAASTKTARVGSSVMVLPQRDPILAAKMAATIDELSGGRLALGVGAGWCREEFEALGWDFKSRGRRMEEAIDVMRRCWEGSPEPFTGEFFSLPEGLTAYPTPVQPGGVPILVGGMADVALKRAGRLGDGWLALLPLAPLNNDELDGVVDRLGAMLEMAREARPAGMPPMRNILSVGKLEDRHVPLLKPIAALGFEEIVTNTTWENLDAVDAKLRLLVSALD